MATTFHLQIARDVCGDPDLAVTASRAMAVAQNAGLTLGGIVNVLVAFYTKGDL
jgi:hypothetical protein